MYPHVKVFHLINSNSNKEKLKILEEHKNDAIFKQLVEIMSSPDYVFIYVEEPKLIIEPTVDTNLSIKKFILLMHKAQASTDYSELFKFISTLDKVTQYVYLHVVRGNDLGLPFTSIASTLGLYVRRTYAEIPRTFGFPSFPFFVFPIYPDVEYFDVHYYQGLVSTTFIDGRKVKDFDYEVYTELQQLNLSGVVKGFMLGGTYFVTNYYTSNGYGKFMERLGMVEVELLKNNSSHIKVQSSLEIENVYDLEDLPEDVQDIICVPDEEQKLDGGHNIFLLSGNKLVALIEKRKRDNTWKK